MGTSYAHNEVIMVWCTMFMIGENICFELQFIEPRIEKEIGDKKSFDILFEDISIRENFASTATGSKNF